MRLASSHKSLLGPCFADPRARHGPGAAARVPGGVPQVEAQVQRGLLPATAAVHDAMDRL